MNRKFSHLNAMRRFVVAATLAICPVAYGIDLADTPLFLTVEVPPNLILTLDDSGSMSRAFTPDLCGNPDGICDSNPDSRLDHRYLKSSHFNPLFYNPNIKYEPPKNAAGTTLTTSFTAAYLNGFDTAYGVVDLSSAYRPSAGLHISSAGTKTQNFMRHYLDAVNANGDVRCKSGAPNNNRCQYTTDKGSNWTNMTDSTSCGGSTATCRSRTMPAYYYKFDTSVTGCSATDTTDKTDNNCYKMVIVGANSGPGTFDLDGNGTINAADKDETQNFANWYSFYRTRQLMTISAASRAFANVPATTRVGWQALKTCRGSTDTLVTNDCEGWATTSPNFTNAIRPFTSTHRANFYSWLVRLPTSGATPLRESLKRVGTYLTVNSNTVATLTDTPYDHFTETYPSDFLPLACRKNFHILMTDGIWNDTLTTSNADNTAATLPDGTSYTAAAPFQGSDANTLADIAFTYWITDLSSGGSGLSNTIIPTYKDRSGTTAEQFWNPVNNPATWQHLVNFTVGLGLTPFLDAVSLTYANDGLGGSYPGLKSGATPWPAIGSDGGKVADLWHAAINSRGSFFSADDPQALNSAFSTIIRSVSDATPSAASLAANSTQWQEGSVVYQAKFSSRDWSGNFLALPVSNLGEVGSPYWDAADKLPAPASRKFYTLNGTTKQEARCTGTGNFQTALNSTDSRCADRLNWLKGDSTNEVRNVATNVNATFRNRLGSKLGDIINSDPMYVKGADFGYGDSTALPATERTAYTAYLTTTSTRMPMVYVGANDGMLHAFRSDTGNTTESGKEIFSYIPQGVYGNLAQLTDQTYSHRYYVDGPPMAGDAYIDSTWKTLLVGGLNGGGKTIYALDVTDPLNFDQTDILWEYADANDLGFTYAQPQIGRLVSGDWVAIFGNGYNSTNGRAYLYVVNLADGALLAKIPAGTATDNGLSTPLLWDGNNDKIIDYVYAGDLKGNLWKFDLTSTSRASWGVGNSGNAIFSAMNINGQQQPITAQPKVSLHPQGGVLVLFGTGRYLGDDDVPTTDIQTFYGIRDTELGATITRSELQQQTIDDEAVIGTNSVRVTSANSVDYAGTPPQRGWYMDMVFPSTSTTGGERVISTASFIEDRIIFTTVIPSRDPCAPGGVSWLMELLTLTGGRPSETVLDANNDNTFTSGDNYGSNPISGVASTIGIIKVPVIIKKDTTAFKILTGTSGGFMTVKNKIPPPGPGTVNQIYWRQIQ